MTLDTVDRPEQKSFLVADCGTTNTTVVLFDVVDGIYRLIAHASVPTTVNPPWSDITQGLQQAITRLSEMTGRPLFQERGTLLTPARDNGAGIDHFAAVVSAAPPLKTLLVGLFDEVSMASARQAMKYTYSQEIDHFNLADTRDEQEKVAAVLEQCPDLIFIVGGTDGGADNRLMELVEAIDVAVDIVAKVKKPQILFAGNRELRERVQKIFQDNSRIQVADNVRPALEVEQTDAAAKIIGELYEDLKINALPGIHEVNDWSTYPLMPTAQGFAKILHYLAMADQGRVLGVDIGSDSVTFVAAEPDRTNLSIRSDLGIGRPLANLLNYIDPADIVKWMASEMSVAAVRDFIHHKTLYPHTIPVTDVELQLEQAVVRELIRCTVAEINPENWGWLQNQTAWRHQGLVPPCRTLVARGGTLAGVPRLGQVMLMLLDALQPVGIFSMMLDRYGLMPGLGLLSGHEPLVAIQAMQSGGVIDLGWVVAPVGRGQPGQKVLHVTVEVDQIRWLEDEVEFGTLDVISLEPGQAAEVTLQPIRRFDIGFGPGQGTTLSLQMGAVGLVIDARGRPLHLPQDDVARRSLIRQWLWDIGG